MSNGRQADVAARAGVGNGEIMWKRGTDEMDIHDATERGWRLGANAETNDPTSQPAASGTYVETDNEQRTMDSKMGEIPEASEKEVPLLCHRRTDRRSMPNQAKHNRTQLGSTQSHDPSSLGNEVPKPPPAFFFFLHIHLNGLEPEPNSTN